MKSLAIEREFGSGGREIGMKVAETAKIPYYDGELLYRAAEAQGISVGKMSEYDEKRIGSILYDIAAYADIMQGNGESVYEIFNGLKKTIEQLQIDGPAVFIGRCSTDILKDSSKTLRVFIYSSDSKDRIYRTVKKEGVSESEARKLLEKKDRQRKNYFRFWTHKEWMDRNNYDMELNTSILSIETCVKILLSAMNV